MGNEVSPWPNANLVNSHLFSSVLRHRWDAGLLGGTGRGKLGDPIYMSGAAGVCVCVCVCVVVVVGVLALVWEVWHAWAVADLCWLVRGCGEEGRRRAEGEEDGGRREEEVGVVGWEHLPPLPPPPRRRPTSFSTAIGPQGRREER